MVVGGGDGFSLDSALWRRQSSWAVTRGRLRWRSCDAFVSAAFDRSRSTRA